jgi:hypothetical protein
MYEPLEHGGRTEHQFGIESLRFRPADRGVAFLTEHTDLAPRAWARRGVATRP